MTRVAGRLTRTPAPLPAEIQAHTSKDRAKMQQKNQENECCNRPLLAITAAFALLSSKLFAFCFLLIAFLR
jgi:hypothetical protein